MSAVFSYPRPYYSTRIEWFVAGAVVLLLYVPTFYGSVGQGFLRGFSGIVLIGFALIIPLGLDAILSRLFKPRNRA